MPKLYRLICIEHDNDTVLEEQKDKSLAVGIHKGNKNSPTVYATDWFTSFPSDISLSLLTPTGVDGCISQKTKTIIESDQKHRK